MLARLCGMGPVALLVLAMTSTQLLAASNPKGGIALVAGAEGGVLQLVDLADNSVFAEIPIFDEGSRSFGVLPFDVKATPDGLWAYVSSAVTGQVFVVNLVLQRVETVLRVGYGPTELAMSPDGSFVYVSCSLSGADQTEYIYVIATKDRVPFKEIPTPVAPLGIAFTPDGTRALVTNPAVGDGAGGVVTLVDATTHTIKGTIPVGGTPAGIAVEPTGHYAYVANTIDGAVVVIDLNASPPAVVGKVELGALTTPTAIAVSPDGSKAQVTNSVMGLVTVLDLSTPEAPTVSGQVAVGTLPTDVVYSADGKHSYVSNTGSNTLSVLDNTADPPAVVTTIDVGDVHPRGIDIVGCMAATEILFRPEPGNLPWFIGPGGSKSWWIELPIDPTKADQAHLIITAWDIDNADEARVRLNKELLWLPPTIVAPGGTGEAEIQLDPASVPIGSNLVSIWDMGGTDGFVIADLAIRLRFPGGCALEKRLPNAQRQAEGLSGLVEKFLLTGNFPNPFNPSTTIDFQLPVESHVSITIFNTNGQLIRTLVDRRLPAGAHTIQWDGLDERGSHVAAGVYLCRMKAGDFMDTKRMVMVK
ncbi:MAG: FlgD immunoglobulin-like domain containing protein [Candidatus Oleimicrobiaceae bacterium]